MKSLEFAVTAKIQRGLASRSIIIRYFANIVTVVPVGVFCNTFFRGYNCMLNC